MITGMVVARHALLPVVRRIPGQPDVAIEFVVDTGFTGFPALPRAAAATLGLPFLHRIPADLADDTTIEVDVFAATVLWNGEKRTIRVLATGRRPLLGTAMLDGSEVVAQFRDGGLVTVDAL